MHQIASQAPDKESPRFSVTSKRRSRPVESKVARRKTPRTKRPRMRIKKRRRRMRRKIRTRRTA